MSEQNDSTNKIEASGADTDSIYRAPSSNTNAAPDGDLLATYVGPKNTPYYARHFGRFESMGSAVSWNWPAFFVTGPWLLYRKMWLYALSYLILLPIVLVLLSVVVGLVIDAGVASVLYNVFYFFIAFLFVPMFANRLYFRLAQNKVDKVTAGSSPTNQHISELTRIGGTSNIVFVLVPLFLIMLVGILAAIAVPAYQDYTIRAQVAEGLNLAAEPKAAVAEHFWQTGELAADNETVGLGSANRIDGQFVVGVAVNRGDVIITYGNLADLAIADKTLMMVPEAQPGQELIWGCKSEGDCSDFCVNVMFHGS